MGLALAGHGQITFKDGRPQQSNFDGFVVVSINEAPLDVPGRISSPPTGTCRPAVSASRVCRRSLPRCATRSSP